MLMTAWLAVTVTSLQADLIHRYEFNGNVKDSVGGVNGRATGATTHTEAALFTADVPEGVVAGAPARSLELGMNKEGKKSGFDLKPTVISTEKGAFSFWMKADTLGKGNYVFSALFVPDGVFVMSPDGKNLQAAAVNDGSNLARVKIPVSTEVWNHVVVSWDNAAGKLSFYFNGRRVAGGDNSFSPGGIAPKIVRVGGFSLLNNPGHFNQQFDGHLYDIQIYGDTLSEQDVAFLFNNPGSVASSPKP